jgi:hypothetical protein
MTSVVVAEIAGGGSPLPWSPSGGGIGCAEVEVIASWRRGYLIMRASSASWAVEVAWCEWIRLCSGDTSLGRWVAGHLFVGMVGLLS